MRLESWRSRRSSGGRAASGADAGLSLRPLSGAASAPRRRSSRGAPRSPSEREAGGGNGIESDSGRGSPSRRATIRGRDSFLPGASSASVKARRRSSSSSAGPFRPHRVERGGGGERGSKPELAGRADSKPVPTPRQESRRDQPRAPRAEGGGQAGRRERAENAGLVSDRPGPDQVRGRVPRVMATES